MAVEPLLAATRAAARDARLREVSEKIRARTDLTAKFLGTIGTAAITAIGYLKLADIFPYGGPDWAVVGLILGVPAMIAAVWLLLRRFTSAAETIVTTADADQTIQRNTNFDKDDEKIVREKYNQEATLNRVDSLAAYRARGHRFERIADRHDDSLTAPLRARADVIMAEVLATQTLVSTLILRKRAKDAVSGWPTLGWVALFVVGWYLTALSADAMQSERSDKVQVAKSCAEAREKATPESQLPTICGTSTDEGGGATPDPGETSAAAVVALAEARSECLKQAEEIERNAVVCVPLSRALAAAVSEGPG